VTTQTKQPTKRQILEDLVALFVVGEATGYVLLQAVTELLTLFGLSAPTARWLATLTAGGNAPPELGVPTGPAQEQEAEHAKAWLGMYLVAAAGRLMEATEADVAGERGTNVATTAAQKAEERYYQLHRSAEGRRMRAAALVDMAARLNSDRGGTGDELAAAEVEYLGWRAVIDNKTTPECRAANGLNFKADRMPVIGWPGAVHVECRCSAGPAVPGAGILPSV